MMRRRWRPCNSSRPSSRSGAAINEAGQPRGRRLRRARAGARVRHARLRRRRGRPARPRPRVRRRLRGAHRRLRGRLRLQGVPVHRGHARVRRGGARLRRRVSGGELALALRAGFTGDRIHMHGNAKSLDELRAARAAGVRHVVIDNLDEIDRLEQVVARTAASRSRCRSASRPACAATRTTRSPPARPTRSSASPTRDVHTAIERLAGQRARSTSRACTCTSARRSSRSRRSARRSRRSPTCRRLPRGQPRRRPRRRLHARAGAAADRRLRQHEGPGRARRLRRRACASSTSPAARWWRTPRVTLYTVQSVKTNVSTYVAVDGGMSDNLRPMLYGARYEAHAARCPRPAASRASSSASTASPAT